MGRPLLLDLYCGAGGCSMGYYRAGFEIVGVDHKPQPNYPFAFREGDALEALEKLLKGHSLVTRYGKRFRLEDFAAVHASPPCQRYSKARHTPGSRGREYPDLLPATLKALEDSGKPWVVENVPGAPLPWAIELCGTMFGLRLRRHRLFMSDKMLLAPATTCTHRDGDLTVFGYCVQVTGSRGVAYKARTGRTHYRPLRVGTDAGRAAMGIDWMNRGELSQAIPPAYCEFVGRQLLARLA